MSFGLRPFGISPYGLIQTPARSYTMTAETGAFTLTGNAVNFGITMPAGTGTFTLTGNDAALTYTPPTETTTAGGLPRRKKRKARDATEGNRDFLGSLRNSRPGVAEEEMREVLATVKAKAVPIPLDAIEDDDEEAILWLI